jgi:crotonobetainyl-CoA:carnitine CoA-transferase CaiB-like acyl-CoA transferase
MGGALENIRVLDCTDCIAGQFCGRMLADYGADVTLIEPPAGTATRRAAPFAPNDPSKSLLFHHLNTGKHSVSLDRASPHSQQRLAELSADADVAIVDTIADRDALTAANPHTVVAFISPFGADGPYANWRGTEMIYQALAGIMRRNGRPDRPPLYGCGDRASYGAGVAAYIAILAALHARETIGIGQLVSVDIAETTASMANPFVTQYLYNGMEEPRGRAIPLARLRCRDGWIGFWLHVHLWPALCDALEAPDLLNDPRFAQGKARLDNWPALEALIQAMVANQSATDLLARLQHRKIVAAPIPRLSALRDDPHLAARHYWDGVSTPSGIGPVLGPQFRFSATPRILRGGPPALGDAPPAARTSPPTRTTAPPPATGPLTGIRVVELTTAWAGPMAGRILAFLGAEVIHVEAADRLDSWRMHKQVFNPHRYPPDGAGDRPWNRAVQFNSQNENKLSLTLDTKKPGGLATLRRLIAKSDVVLCNFTAGTLTRMGVGYDQLCDLHPGIIVAEMPAFGTGGPMSHATAIGPSMEMAAGMAGMIGYKGGPPEVSGPTYPDPIGAYHGAAAVLTALIHLQRTGQGQHVEIPQVEAAMHYIGEHILAALLTGNNPEPDGNRVPHAAPHGAFPAAGNDEWVAIAITNDAKWQTLCRIIGDPALAGDPRYATHENRLRNQDALEASVAAWTRQHDKHATAEALQAAGVPAAPVNGGKDGAHSPYLAARGWFKQLDHPEVGRIAHEGLPFHFSLTPGTQRSAAPCLGQHTTQILSGIVGLSDTDIAELARAGTTSAEPT